jgi:hypothetical protein
MRGQAGKVANDGKWTRVSNSPGVLLTRRMMDSPRPPRAFVDFRNSAYRRLNVASDDFQNNFAFDVGATRTDSSC